MAHPSRAPASTFHKSRADHHKIKLPANSYELNLAQLSSSSIPEIKQSIFLPPNTSTPNSPKCQVKDKPLPPLKSPTSHPPNSPTSTPLSASPRTQSGQTAAHPHNSALSPPRPLSCLARTAARASGSQTARKQSSA